MMIHIPIARNVYSSVAEITPQFLHSIGVKLLLCDLDNTLAPYSPAPSQKVKDWVEILKQNGITVFVISNTGSDRVEKACEFLDVDFIKKAGKPKPDNILKAIKAAGGTVSGTALVGDQVFTDVLGAKRSNIIPLLVKPMDIWSNPLRALRHLLEQPFIIASKRNMKRK